MSDTAAPPRPAATLPLPDRPPSDLPFARGAERAQREREQLTVRVMTRLTATLALLTVLSIPIQSALGAPASHASWRWLTAALLLGATGAGLALARSGRLRAASAVLFGVTQLSVGLFAWGSGLGLMSALLTGSPVLIVLAGVLTHARVAWLLGGLQVALLLALHLAHGTVDMAAVSPGGRLATHVLVTIGALFAAVTVGRQVSRTLHEALVKEHRLSEMLRLGSDWTWEADRRGRLTSISPSFARHTGRSVAEFLNLDQPGGPRPVRDAEWERLLADLRARRPYRARVITFECADGSMLCVRGSGEPVLDEAGQHVGWWGLSQNVTAEVMAAREHDRSRALLDSLVRLSPDAISVVNLRDGHIMLANPRFLAMAGYERLEQIHGCTALELGIWRDPAEPLKLRDALRESSTVRDLKTVFWNHAQVRRDALLTAARFEWDGQPVAVIITRDVTDAERARMQGDAILNHAAVGVALVRDQRLERVNPQLERLLGRPVGSLAGQPVSTLFDNQADYQGFLDEVARLARAGLPVEVEHEMGRGDGSRFVALLRSQLVDPRQPEAAGAIWVVEDITARRQAEQALESAKQLAEAASDAKSAFLAHVSHEIRTPLNGVLGLASLMAEPGQSDARRQEYLAYLIDAAESLNGIVSNVLDLSKMEAGKLHVESIEFDLVDLVDKVHGAHAVLAEAKGLVMQRAVAGDVPRRVRGDPLRLRQIVSNFIANAIKFTNEGSVLFRVRRGGPGRLRFEVEDTGIGIDRGVLAGLFQPFAQADHSTTRRFGGTGLGLSITRELAQLMGGEVGAHSSNGQGTTFWAELPLLEVTGPAKATLAPAADPINGEPAGDMPLRGLRLLLAEDNPVNMLIAVEMLVRLGADVSQASDGAQAVMACQCAPDAYDVVLMDLHMPLLDGLAAVRELRRDPLTAKLPVVAFSAAALDHERAQARAAGMDDFVAKPVRRDELLRVLSRWVP